MHPVIQEISYGIRALTKNWGFTLIAALTLALGIGVNTAIFSVVNALLLRPLPYADANRLISVTSQDVCAQATLVALREQRNLVDYAGYTQDSELNLTGQGEPTRLVASEVSANFFRLLGVRPLVGRDFQDGEDQAGRGHVVLLSYSLWKSRFDGAVDVVGRSLMIDDQMREIIGVMPSGFRFPSPSSQIWIPMQIDPANVSVYYFNSNTPLIGKLREGASMEKARAEFKVVIAKLQQTYRSNLPEWGNDANVAPLQEVMVAGVRSDLLVLSGAVALVLLVSCANFSNLLVVRNVARRNELSLRAALGASRTRILVQVLTESIMLAIVGGALGLLVCWVGTALLTSWLTAEVPRTIKIGVDLRVLGFTASVSVLAGLVFGLIPALGASKLDSQRPLCAGGRTIVGGRKAVLAAFMVLETAIAVIVVMGAGLLARSIWTLSNNNPGFTAQNVLTAKLTPPRSVCKERVRCIAFYRQVVERIHGLPGVVDASAVSTLPLSGDFTRFAAELEGHPWVPGLPVTLVWDWTVSPDYLRTMRIPLLQGRDFSDSDGEASESVAIVSAATARKYWPGQDPVGKHIRGIWEKGWRRVVGVAGDVHPAALGMDPLAVEGQAYFPFATPIRPTAEMTLIVRATTNPSRMMELIRQIVVEVNSDVPLSHMQSMREVVQDSISQPRSAMRLLASFAVLALLLVTVGMYGVISYAVNQRRGEIAVRLALGARPLDIRRLILGHSLKLVVAGLAIGLPAALAATRVLQSQLFELRSSDPFTYAVGSLMVVGVAAIAAWLPARRASRRDPIVALRYA